MCRFLLLRFCIVLGIATFLGGNSAAWAVLPAPAYKLMILNPQEGYFNSISRAVNAAGVVVGNSFSHPMLGVATTQWFGGESFPVPIGGGIQYDANAVNDLGHIVGTAVTGSVTQVHAYYFDGVTAQDIHSPTLSTIGNFSTALAVNNAGHVAGFASTSGGGPRAAYVWKDGATVLLGTFGGRESVAFAVNNAGIVAGSAETAHLNGRAFVWSDANGNGKSDPGEMVGLPDIGWSSVANAINDLNQVAGFIQTKSALRLPAFWSNTSTFTLLPLLSGATEGEVFSINNHGDAVGVSPGFGPTLWRGGQAYDLNELVGGASEYRLIRASGINDQGWIAGEAAVSGVSTRGFLLIPIPEPTALCQAAAIMIGITVGPVGNRRRKT